MAFAMWKVKRHLLKQRMRKLVYQRTCGDRVSRCGCGMQHGSQVKNKQKKTRLGANSRYKCRELRSWHTKEAILKRENTTKLESLPFK